MASRSPTRRPGQRWAAAGTGRLREPSAGGPRPDTRALTGGGTDGNERLTVLTGLALFVLLAALGVTIVWIGQLLWLHLFLGLALIGPVILKLASTGYRFVRYYTSSPAYRLKGPPAPALRALAPLVVLSTLVVFVTGVVLLALGAGGDGGIRSLFVLLHKVSFIVWIVVTAVHVLGHLDEVRRVFGTAASTRREMATLGAAGESPLHSVDPLPGRSGRSLALGGTLVAGLVLAVALIPLFASWTHAAGH